MQQRRQLSLQFFPVDFGTWRGCRRNPLRLGYVEVLYICKSLRHFGSKRAENAVELVTWVDRVQFNLFFANNFANKSSSGAPTENDHMCLYKVVRKPTTNVFHFVFQKLNNSLVVIGLFVLSECVSPVTLRDNFTLIKIIKRLSRLPLQFNVVDRQPPRIKQTWTILIA